MRFPFQADIYSLLRNLSCFSLRNLSVIYAHPEASVIEKLRNIFPSIDILELATSVDSKRYSAKIDFKACSFTEVFGYFEENIMLILSFKEPQVARRKPPSEMDLLSRFKDKQTIIKGPEPVSDLIDLIPKLKALHLSFVSVNLNLDSLNSFITKIECLEIEYRSHSFSFYHTETFSARRLSLSCKFGFEADFLNWVALRFPKVEILEIGSPSEDISWKETFPSLTHLICHCPNLRFLMHILRLTPKINSLVIFVSNVKKLNIDTIYVAYPDISITIKETRYMVMADNDYY
ncbi:hypothetical protein DSO57_1020480 [Entomophthora muscae]|uniref:Uncharacterized protein n=1 Tax=Entomophthora muscae TaxID=34485 RepID=A0ACC2UD81_9FUNG|nr:hypothetical protein DSO57_1020480 [Entomophthora muscae]